MSTKSDFAQKLLHDLRMRKERMAATQNTGHQSRQTSSRDMRGNPGQTNKGSRRINALESAGSSTRNTSRRSYGGSKSMNTKESSNQIVLYDNGQSSRQVRDLSMAIAFAFENSGNLSKIGASSSNPLVNFFNRFGRRSMSSQKISFDNESFSNYKFNSVSNIHVTEISKGVQKLNQILKACSNGLNLDRNSIEVGKELLKGAIDLEESLRMLANMNSTRQRNQIKLLDEDEDDQDNNDKKADTWKLGRPRFSFDGPSRDNTKRKQLALSYLDESYEQPISNSKMVPYKAQNNSSPSQPSQDKGKISNVIAKLMGLEELPHKGSTSIQNDSKGKALRLNSKLSEPLSRERRKDDPLVTEKRTSTTPLVRDSKKILEAPHASSKVAYSEENQPRKDLKILKGGINVIVPKQVDGLQIDRERRKNLKIGGEKKTTETSDSKTLVSNTKLQKKAENSKTVKSDDRTHNRIEYKVSANYLEQGNSDQEHFLKSNEHLEKKHQAGQKGQNLMAKKYEIESKPKKSAPIDIQKRLLREKLTPGYGRVTKPTGKVPKKDSPNKDAPIIDNSHKTAVNQENLNKEGKTHNSSPTKPQFDTEKETRNPALTQKKAISKKIQETENPRKLDLMMSRRDAKLNHLERSGKQSDMHKRIDVKEGNRGVNMNHASEMSTEAMKPIENLNNEDDQITTLNNSFPDESQIQSILETQTPGDNSDTIASKFENISDDLQTIEQTYAFKDEHELKQIDQSTGHEQSMELYNIGPHEYNQCPVSTRQEQLTEPEKELKEIAIKSQLFLSTAEALFKLNIPVTFLHASDQDNEVGEKKLVLDCAYEAMKRKAKRNEVTSHPYTKTSISCAKVRSLDDLIKQLCKDLEMLKIYGGNGSDIAEGLHKMLNKDIYNNDPDINSMWDFAWTKTVSILPEKEDVIRDVEKHMLNGLLDEITKDLILITIPV